MKESVPNPNERLLLSAVEKLAPLLDRIVFVGGCATGMLLTDPGAATVRVTRDVDVIVELANRFGFGIADEILRRKEPPEDFAAPVRKTQDVDTIANVASYTEFTTLETQLRELGFRESREEGAPVCRWVSGELILDVMPTDSAVLGFSNRWYRAAFENATKAQVHNYKIRLITAPYFLATKLEAFHGRGKGDYQASHDLEDIVTIIDGRPEIVAEVHLADPELRKFLSQEFRNLVSDKNFMESLSGFLLPDAASQQRRNVILQRINSLVGDE